jgi:hypothetical protein
VSVVDCIIAPFFTRFAAQRQAVGEVAVMGDCKTAGIEFGEERLDVAQDGFARGGVADMADGGGAGQALDHFAAGEGVADEAEAAFGMEALAVEGDDAGRFLAAMLEGVQAERGERRRIGMAVDAEYTAFLAQHVAIEIGISHGGARVVGRALHRIHRAFQVSRETKNA